MLTSNKKASTLAQEYGAKCATDVSGYGILGHAHSIGIRSGISVELFPAMMPRMRLVSDVVEQGIAPASAERLMREAERFSSIDRLDAWARIMLCEPQTSGGLLVAISPALAAEFCERLPGSEVVGELGAREPGYVEFR